MVTMCVVPSSQSVRMSRPHGAHDVALSADPGSGGRGQGHPASLISAHCYTCALCSWPRLPHRVSRLSPLSSQSSVSNPGFLFLASSGPSYLWCIANTFISCRKKTATNFLVVREFYLVWGIIKGLSGFQSKVKRQSIKLTEQSFHYFLYIHILFTFISS